MREIFFSDLYQIITVLIMVADGYIQAIYAFSESYQDDRLLVTAYVFVIIHQIIMFTLCVWLMHVSNVFKFQETIFDKIKTFFLGILAIIFRTPIWKVKELEDGDNPIDYLSLAFANIPQVILLNIPMLFVVIINSSDKDSLDNISVIALCSNILNLISNGIIYPIMFKYIISD